MIARKEPGQAMAHAAESWGGGIPDWVEGLAREIDGTSNAKAARRVGYSPAVVNAIVRKIYRGNYSAVEQAVRGALMDATVTCPVLGPIKGHQCSANQRRKFSAVNPQAVRLYRACHGGHCEHSRVAGPDITPLPPAEAKDLSRKGDKA